MTGPGREDEDAEVIPEAELPEPLRAPPWERKRRPRTETVLRDLGTPQPPALSWLPGEQQEWANLPMSHRDPYGGWEAEMAKLGGIDNDSRRRWMLEFFALAPQELVAPHVGLLRSATFEDQIIPMRRLLGRFGEAVVEMIVESVRMSPNSTAVLLPMTGTPITAEMAKHLGPGRGRTLALTWFERHLSSAATDLIAMTLGASGYARSMGWRAIGRLITRGHHQALTEAAAGLGEQAAAVYAAELATTPWEMIAPWELTPQPIPTFPTWLVPADLPPILLRDNAIERQGGRTLPPSAVATMCSMLAIIARDSANEALARIADLAEPDSMAEFAWALFETWRRAGSPLDDIWTLNALGSVGNDEIARRLVPFIHSWSDAEAGGPASPGIDVLSAIGSDAARMLLDGIAEDVKSRFIKNEARRSLRQVAHYAGMSLEDLMDRLVPTSGLSEDILLRQIRRLEHAMVTTRRWTAATYRRLFVDHPVMHQLSRGLVWIACDADGTVTGSFRIAEDGGFADIHDTVFTLADTAIVGIAHPLHLADTVRTWGEIFADYEILQPFPQLARDIHSLTDEERSTSTLGRCHNLTVPTANVIRLNRFGWELIEPDEVDYEEFRYCYRRLGGQRSAVLDLYPGIKGTTADPEQQRITAHIVNTGQEDTGGRWHMPCTFDDLDAIAASELLRELETLTD